MVSRRIFIGDVQGCRDPFLRLLDRLRFDPASDRVYLCGDLVNRGPDSPGVLRLARTIAAESVLGNHDVYLLEIAAGRIPATAGHPLEAVLEAEDRDDLIGWLAARPLAIAFGDVFLVHAAVRPTWADLAAVPAMLRASFEREWSAGRSPLGDADVRFALTARYTTPEGIQPAADWPPPRDPYRNWLDFYRDARTVVFGHFARQGLVTRERARGLDTGCVYGQQLTAWIAETDELVAVPARA
jgi:bis(5'-nucleosyl)-tetraphosphatase (symmetrical)